MHFMERKEDQRKKIKKKINRWLIFVFAKLLLDLLISHDRVKYSRLFVLIRIIFLFHFMTYKILYNSSDSNVTIYRTERKMLTVYDGKS